MTGPTIQRDPVDAITLAFGLVLAPAVGLASGHAGTGLVLAAVNAALALAASAVLPRLRTRTGLARFFGLALPLLVFYVLYRETHLALSQPDIGWLDAGVARLEWPWWERTRGTHGSRLIGELLALAYMAYVPLILLLVAVLGRRAQRGPDGPAEALVRRICVAWVICYLLFLAVPVLGPRFVFPDVQPPRLGTGPFSALATFNQDHGMLRGAAFPSAHVAATVVAVWSAWRWWRAGFWAVLPIAAALAAGAVYLGYHYVVDVVAGAAVGAAAVAIDAATRRLPALAPMATKEGAA